MKNKRITYWGGKYFTEIPQMKWADFWGFPQGDDQTEYT